MRKFSQLSTGKKVFTILCILFLVNLLGFTALFFLLGGPHIVGMLRPIFFYQPSPEEDYSPAGRIKTQSKAIAKNPRDAKAYEQRAKAYESLDDNKSALKDMNMAISIKSDEADWYRSRADIHYSLWHLEDAVADYTRAIELAPDSDSLYVARAHVYTKFNKSKLALADYAQALKVAKSKGWIYFNRARLYEELGENKKAIADYNNAINTPANNKSGDQQSVRQLVDLHDRLGETDEAIKACDRWIIMNPTSYDAYRMRGDMYEQIGQSDKAKADYAEAEKLITKEIDGGSTSYFDTRAEIRQKMGHIEGAKKDWLREIEKIKKKQITFVGGLSEFDEAAELYDKIGDAAAAKEWRQKHVDQLTEEIKKNPQVADTYHDRGVIYDAMNDHAKALSDFTQALALSPNNADYHHHIAGVYIKQKKYPQALAEAQKSVELSAGTGSDYHEVLAHALELSGKHEAAITAANQALVHFKSDGHALYWRAQAEQHLGQTTASKRDFARAKRFGVTEERITGP